jgi:predicted Zn-dependent protease
VNRVCRIAAALCAAVVLGQGCATNPVTGSPDLVFMSEQQEIALGQQANRQVLSQYAIYDDIELQNYVQHVGRKVAERSHRSNLDYRFTVLDSPEVNAFALPGGYIFITRGLMAYLNSEAELAAVLGHEVGHVTARHAVRQHSATQLTGLGAALGAAFVPGMGQAVTQQLAGVLGTALLRGYGRDHELEADRLGAEYLGRAGYDPRAMLSVIRALKNQELYEVKAARAEGREPNVYHGLFSTHPDSDTRLQEVIAGADQVTRPERPFIGRSEYLERINGLVFGENTRQGILRGRDFYHGQLGFALRFPAGWRIRNLPDKVIAGAPAGDAIMQLSVARPGAGDGPREVLLKGLGVPRLTDERALKVHGLPAHTGIATVNTDDGPKPARFTAVLLGRNVFVVAGISRDPGSFGRHDPAFRAAGESFRSLGAEEKAAAAATPRIATLVATEATTFPGLARGSPLGALAEEQIRLINARYPRGEIRPGETLKTVQ